MKSLAEIREMRVANGRRLQGRKGGCESRETWVCVETIGFSVARRISRKEVGLENEKQKSHELHPQCRSGKKERTMLRVNVVYRKHLWFTTKPPRVYQGPLAAALRSASLFNLLSSAFLFISSTLVSSFLFATLTT